MTDFREFFIKNTLLVFAPEDIGSSASSFVAQYGSFMNEIGIVAKRSNGYATFPSRTAPVESEHTKVFEDLVNLTSKLKVNTVVAMDFYTDGWFARDPKYQTINPQGESVEHQVCPNREEFWQYGAEIVKELGVFPINEILVFGAGFISDKFCFCERCRAEFAPIVGQEPTRLSHAFLVENTEHHNEWHRWRSEKVTQGLAYLKAAAQEADDAVERSVPLKLTIELPVDPETGLTEGARIHHGLDPEQILELSKSILINLYPWSPLLPTPGSSEYSKLVDSLYFVNAFKRRGGTVSLFRWGVKNPDTIDDLIAIAKDIEIDRIITTFTFPYNYARRRESVIWNL